MKFNLFFAAVFKALLLFVCGMAYVQPLRKRGNRMVWIPVSLIACLTAALLENTLGGMWTIAVCLAQYGALVLLVNRHTQMSFSGDCYCAVWSFLTYEVIEGRYGWICEKLPVLKTTPVWFWLGFLLFGTAVLVLLNRTIARKMPQKDIYQIGPRQLSSALLLGCMFAVMHYMLYPMDTQYLPMAPALFICQVYCVSVLFLQTELFKKSQMQKDMDALNFLYSCEQRNYETACQNVRLVNGKCKELDEMTAQIRQYLPEDLQKNVESRLHDAMRACDTVVESGNSVLDTVLAEKKMLAESLEIPINCVADGKLLDFMDVVDIYALFSNALDNAIEATSKITDPNHRLIDMLVHESQNFLVINISNPIRGSLQFEEDLPVTTKAKKGYHGYGLRVLQRAIEKYHGIFTVESADGLFTLRVLVPLPKNQPK